MKIFKPCEELLHLSECYNYGVILLNSPVKLVSKSLWKIWNEATLRVLVDGGSESWISWTKNKSEENCDLLLPHLVTGDFDSISPETLEKFKKMENVQVIHTPDQNETDFTKALREFDKFKLEKNMKIENIHVLTEISGRLDQIMANINTLFLANYIVPDTSLFLLSPNSISWLLKPGDYSISIPKILRDNEECCGLIPIGHPAVVTTSGLKWNLSKGQLMFGKLLSTSNTYDGDPEVKIETDSCILWTMDTTGLFCDS